MMVTHVCPRCGYETNKRSNLKAHVFRKIPCDANIEDIPLITLQQDFNTRLAKKFACECGKGFVSMLGYVYHKNVCKRVKENLEKYDVLEKLRGMQEELDELKKHKKTDTSSTTNNNYTTTNNNQSYNNTINQNIHIHLADFGKEDLSHLSTSFYRECLMNGALGVLQMIEKVWFNEEHPENFNIRLSSLKNMLVQYYKHPDWQVCGFHDAIDKMIHTSQNRIITESKVKDLECTNSLVTSMDSVQNLKPEIKRKIKDKCKGKLANRRCQALQQEPPKPMLSVDPEEPAV